MNYYSIRLYVEKIPITINCRNIMNIADEISKLLSCNYDRIGYFLLDPDYDFKNLGQKMISSQNNKMNFEELQIPTLYYGKNDEYPSAPIIFFKLREKDPMTLPKYSINFNYPVLESQCLCISVDVEETLLSEKMKMMDFVEIQKIVKKYGYGINSAIVHYYFGNSRRVLLDGGESGLITINDWRIIDHGTKFFNNWKNKLFDVFLMNAIKVDSISQEAKIKIQDIVGGSNFYEVDGIITFRLPQLPWVYLLNRFITTNSRRKIKKILQDEKVCDKDANILHSILRL